MGRKKIRITRITDDRNRSVTYLKRKAGLMKKAHELAVLTGSEVAVIVFGQNGKLSEFCSSDMDHLLLRYTDHKGPVERRGPEHYQNDNDDDSNYDGGDYDEGDDDFDGSFGGGANGNAGGGQSGPSGDHFSYNGANGGASGEGNAADQASTSKSSTKRKAPRGKKMSDAHSISSGSSRRSSSPFNNASSSAAAGGPMIKIEEDSGVDRNTLKAAIIRNTLSKPRTDLDFIQQINGSNPRPVGMQHHHSFSTPDFNFVPPQAQMNNFGQPRMSMPNIPNGMLPQRPSTAGSGQMAQTPFAMTQQRQSPPRFAFNAPLDQSAAFAQQTQGQQQQFLSPSPVNFPSTTPPSPLGQPGMSSMPSATYGDLARGGSINQSGQSSLTVPGQSNMPGSHSHPVSPTSPSGLGPDGLMPLAHPILKQHPQFESYAQQWRTQQQRNSSVPMIHTAPSSPNFTANGQPLQLQIPGMSNIGNVGHSPISPLPSSAGFIKRSASFGVATADNNGRLMVMNEQQQQQHSAPAQQRGFLNPFGGSSPGTNPMASGVEDSNSLSTHSSLPPPPYAPMANRASPLPANGGGGGGSGLVDGLNGDEVSGANIQQPISNAAFNDLMGSILGDMGSSEDVTNDDDGTTTGDHTLTSSKQEDDVLRSLDSDHSLSTLVSSESFDVLMGNGGGNVDGFGRRSEIKSMHRHKSSIDKNADQTEDLILSTTIDATQDAT